jgi:glutamate-1-semialdehyde aminotransferase/spore coat polysaccharide biosynthesis protein SpsF (cytidylyltransferase family)
MLARQIERVRRSRNITTLVVATSSGPEDDPIAKLCAEEGVSCYRGSLDDVLDRFYRAVEYLRPEILVRLTGDCPLTDPNVIDACIEFFQAGRLDYATNAIQPTFPDGLDVEVMSFGCLEQAWREARLPSEREHVTPFIYAHPERFHIGHYRQDHDMSYMRWTVDEPADLEFVRAVYSALYPGNPGFAMSDILALLDAYPELQELNSRYQRNEGLTKSRQRDSDWLAARSGRYSRSEEFLERATRTIPLGSQTFSKSKTQYPRGVSPFFIQRGSGCHVWDVDGNEYVDFINGLAAITLGYNDSDITAAVSEQLKEGVIFSLPHPIEMQVAEKLAELVPSAEMVRFGKNGSDATSGAIRVARAFTGRDHVAVCGYHGWQDWYIGTTARRRGVPQATRDLSHTWNYNDLDSLSKLFQEYPQQIAAVILEPMNVVEPAPGFLESVKELSHKHGALLVFDETVTGFRYAIGGAQQHFGVLPDIATFGKGLANGYPVSAVAGRADVMRLMEEVFFSFTFGGEALSLAAALATMEKLQREPVTETLYRQGRKILGRLGTLITESEAGDFLSVAGNPTWSFLLIKDAGAYSQWQIKTLFLQEMFSRGILTIGTHNMSYSHADEDLKKLFVAYAEVIPMLADAVRHRKLESLLRCEPLQPLFKIR